MPTDQAIPDYEEISVRALAKTLKNLGTRSGTGDVKFKDLILKSGYQSEAKIGNAQSSLTKAVAAAAGDGDWEKFTDREYKGLMGQLFLDESLRAAYWAEFSAVTQPHSDEVFASTCRWLGMDTESQNEVGRDFPGSYTVYRHSLMDPGKILVGQLAIQRNARGTISTVERYGAELVGGRTRYLLTGFLYRRKGKHLIYSRDYHSHEIQTLYVNHVRMGEVGNNKSVKVIEMAGMLWDYDGHRGYATRFCCVRGAPSGLTSMPASALELESPQIFQHMGRPMRAADGFIASF